MQKVQVKDQTPSMQQVMQHVQTSSSLSSHVEHAVMLHTMRLLQEAFDGKHGFHGVLKLVLVVGFDAIKSSLGATMARLFGSGELLGRIVAWAVATLRRALAAVGLCHPTGCVPPPVAHADAEAVCGTCVQFTPHESFWRLLLLSDDPNWTVSRRVEHGSRSLEQRDMGVLVVTEVWADVVVRVRDGVFALLETPVELAFVHDVGKEHRHVSPLEGDEARWRPDPCMRDVTMRGTSGNGWKMPVAGAWITYLDLLPFREFREDVSKYLEAHGMTRGMGSSNTRADTVKYFDSSSTAANLGFNKATDIFFNALVPNLLLPDLGDTQCAFNEFYIMMSLLLGQSADVKKIAYTNVVPHATRTHRLFGVEIPAKSVCRLFYDATGCEYNTKMTTFAIKCRQSAEVSTWLMRQLFSDFDPPKSATGAKAVTVRMAAGSGAGEWRTFVRDLCAPAALQDENGTASVGVHLARIVEVVTTEQVPNPAHATWLEKEDRGDGDGNDDRNAHRRNQAPAPTLAEQRVSREVCVERVNDIRKPIDTVYLRQEDRMSLMRSLELFRDRRELMSQLGLPHKLGILLHGLVRLYVCTVFLLDDVVLTCNR
jgi:hypothetical protein